MHLCGIFGITLKHGKNTPRTAEILTQGLKSLEYRGYDSVGIALITPDNNLVIKKGKGTINEVSRKLDFLSTPGKTGIGHTRWATHGPPTDINAHPHTDCRKHIALVHNGIIKNYLKLKQQLTEKGHEFKSDTDTEVLAHLIEEFYKEKHDFFQAFKSAVKKLEASYAVAVITLYEPEKIFFAKKESPLVIGLSPIGNLVSSDIPALLEYTNKVIVVADDEIGWITPDNVVLEHKGKRENSEKRIMTVEWKAEMARKGGYPHYMIKEIHEQPLVLKTTYDGLLSDENLVKAAEMLQNAKRIFVAAAGTSYHAGLVTKYFIENFSERMVYPFISSEYRSIEKIVEKGDVLIAISQSGETIDTLKAIRMFKENEGKIIAITNVLGSAIDRESDYTVVTRAGPEIGVAATKTFLTQVLTGSLIAINLGLYTGSLSLNEKKNLINELGLAGRKTGEAISKSERIVRNLSEQIMHKHSAYFLGRGLGVPLSLEGALKMKEISYIHAEAYPAGESKHGPIAIVEEDYPVFFLITTDQKDEIRNNIAEMNARDALTIALVPENELEGINARLRIKLPPASLILQPYVLSPPFQLLSYYTATRLGYNPDKPRNLAKTVTVE